MATVLTYNTLLEDLRRYGERAFSAASDPIVWDQLPRLVNNAERNCARELKVQGFIKNVTNFFQAGLDVYPKPDRWREWISFNYGQASYTLRTVSRSAAAGTRTLLLNKPHGWAVGQSVFISGVGGVGYNGTFVLTAVTQLSISYINGAVTEGSTLDGGGYASIPAELRTPIYPRAYEYIRGYWPDPRLTGAPLYYADYDYFNFIVAPVPDRPYPFELNYYELPELLDDANQTNWLTDIAPTLLLYASLLEMAPFLKNPEMTSTWQGFYGRAAQAITGEDMSKITDRTSDRERP